MSLTKICKKLLAQVEDDLKRSKQGTVKAISQKKREKEKNLKLISEEKKERKKA